MKFTDIGHNEVKVYAIVKKCEIRSSSKGGRYLDIVLSDADGEINAKYWKFDDYPIPIPDVGSIVSAVGSLSEYNNVPQFRLTDIKHANEDEYEIEDVVRSAEYRSESMYSEICNMINTFEDEDLKKLCLKMYEDSRQKLLYYPAAVKLHHAMRGGLLYHTLSIMRVAERICDVYPLIDKDLLLAGAALHDIGKTIEMNSSDLGIASDYTVDGNLIGHLVRGAMMVRKAGTDLKISNDKIRLLEHMLLSHHGKPEFGCAVRPSFTEAAVLSMLDELDAKIYEFADITSQIQPGTFSGRQWALDDVKVYNHGRTPIKPKANLISEEK